MQTPQLPLVVEPAALAGRLGDADLLILDLGEAPAYARGHVPGAIHLPFTRLVRTTAPIGGLLPTPPDLTDLLAGVGLEPERHVIAYDDEGGGRAARLLWTLDMVGHRRASLLNGGMRAWAPEGYPMESEPVHPERSGYEVAAELPGSSAGADRELIRARLADPDFRLLDARGPAEFSGADRRAARGGHIPGARNLEWTAAMDPGRGSRLLPAARLRAMLDERGLTPENEIVTYCQTHHRSSLSYWMLRSLGYPRVRGYPGSWSDWGNAPDTPITAIDGPES